MDDKSIIQLFFDRNEKAIEEAAAKYGSYCRTVAENILASREDAEECVNDALLKAWNAIPPAKPAVLRTFLGRITRNTALDLYKKKTAEKRGGGQFAAVLDELAECVSGGSEPEKEIDKAELTAAINTFLGTLSEDKCALFVRRYWFADSVSDIAQRYGMSENNVSVNLSRIRANLHDYLIERGFKL